MSFQGLINQGLGMGAAFKVASDAQSNKSFQTKEFDELKATIANQQAQIQQLAKKRIRSSRYGYKKLSQQVELLQKAVLGGGSNG